MAKVYITNSSMKQIFKGLTNIKSKISRNEIISDLLNDFSSLDFPKECELHNIFSNADLKEMYVMKMILTDFESLLSKLDANKFNIVENINHQNKNYVHKVKPPAYHLDQNCEWMNKNFNNVKIPESCLVDKENEAKIHTWLISNQTMDFNELNSTFKKQFNSDEDLVQVNYANSGHQDYDNEMLHVEFSKSAKEKYTQLKMLLDSEHGLIIEQYKYAPNYKIDNILAHDTNSTSHKDIKEFHKIKKTYKDVFFDFYKTKYNNKLSFENTVLDAIGFRKCKGCSLQMDII